MPKTQKMLVPVPSHTSPAVFRKIVSDASRACAYASPRTFSPYDVDFTPVSAPCSLRRHGAVTISDVGAGGAVGSAITTRFGGPYAACDPSGPTPPV